MTPAADRRPPSAARAVAGNALAQAAGKAVVLGVGAASIAVTTRYLGAAGYGRFALALALLQSLGVLADAGLTTVVVREGSRTPARLAELIGNALAIRLVLAPAGRRAGRRAGERARLRARGRHGGADRVRRRS